MDDPPDGITAVEDVLSKVSLSDTVVLIMPLVSNNSLLTSTEPEVPIFIPKELFISRLLNLLEPVKSPVGPPRV